MKNLKNESSNLAPLFENFIDKKELASKLSLSESWIDKQMRLGKIRYYRFGRAVRFKFSEVVAALERSSA